MRRWGALGICAVLLAVGGCGGVLSKETRESSTPLDSFAELRSDLKSFQGRTVILGGEVIETRNKPDSTTLLILEKPLGSAQRPTAEDVSGGRFMVRFGRYRDPVLLSPGRRVTVAGKVLGLETEPVGQAPYEYVLLEALEILEISG